MFLIFHFVQVVILMKLLVVKQKRRLLHIKKFLKDIKKMMKVGRISFFFVILIVWREYEKLYFIAILYSKHIK